jgi:hypothetical protein
VSGVFGPPKDPEQAVAVLREAIELGSTHIDTHLDSRTIPQHTGHDEIGGPRQCSWVSTHS